MFCTKELTSLRNELTRNFNSLMKNIEFIEENQKIIPSGLQSVNENLRLQKKFVDYLNFGIDFHETVNFLMLEEHITKNFIDNVLYPKFLILQRKELSKKIYTAKKMNDAGFTTRQIAGVLHCTPATVRNYLK